jgi:glycosyltransferase involved in cell wall biosynthesis
MLVNVLMATYNRAQKVNGEPMVQRAIESFLCNDYQNSILTILNDCSTDNTAEIINQYHGHERIKIYHGEKNKLPPNNWNWLWNKAIEDNEGDLICQLHDDDVLTFDSLSKRVALFNAETQVVYGGVYTQNIDEVPMSTVMADEPNKDRIMVDEYINFTTLMYRRDLPFHFEPTLRYYFDWLFKIRCLKECNVNYTPDPVMLYTVHQGQETNKCRRENMNKPDEAAMRVILKEIYK